MPKSKIYVHKIIRKEYKYSLKRHYKTNHTKLQSTIGWEESGYLEDDSFQNSGT